MTKHQLYTIHKSVRVPSYTTGRTLNSEPTVKYLVIERLPLLNWPNGKPCAAVNMWLMNEACKSTNNSSEAYASQITHLVRFCARKGITFEQLQDCDIYDFAEDLASEIKLINPMEKARNNNTTRSVISRCLSFLMWYQKKYIITTHRVLIGTKEKLPQIMIKKKCNPHNNKTYYNHKAMPPSVSPENDKHPIPTYIIEAIEEEVERRSEIDELNEYASRRYQNNQELLLESLEYVYQRRMFTLFMMKRTGLRPEELCQIPLSVNANILEENKSGLYHIVIPTKKRGKANEPTRSFAINKRDAMIFVDYINARGEFVAYLENNIFDYESTDQLLLGRHGEAIKKDSIRKDFDRLVVGAGYFNTKVCLSMFRHRFITREVMIHLKDFMKENNATRETMGSEVIESILTRIAAKTGHGSHKSLWHYVDMAWEQMGLWNNIDNELQRLSAADRLRENLVKLKHQVKHDDSISKDQLMDHIISQLSDIIRSGKRDLNS